MQEIMGFLKKTVVLWPSHNFFGPIAKSQVNPHCDAVRRGGSLFFVFTQTIINGNLNIFYMSTYNNVFSVDMFYNIVK